MTSRPQRLAPAPPRRHPLLDRLAGFVALLALLALLVGVPLALLSVFGLPVPHSTPSLSLLTHRLDVTAIVRICSVVVWLAWLQLVWCVVAEVSAAVRNTGVPRRVPLAGGTQALVHYLVTTTLLLSATASVTPALMSKATPPAAVSVVHTVPGQPPQRGQAGAVPGTAASAVPDAAGTVAGPTASNGAPATPRADAASITLTAATSPSAPDALAATSEHRGDARLRHDLAHAGWEWATRARTEKVYVVQPPVGRFHESLWEIAQNHLGDGRRYREVFELNKDRAQPDGSMLTIASLIRPGWVLVMPHDAHGPGIREVTLPPAEVQPPGTAPGAAGQSQRGTGHASPGHRPQPGHAGNPVHHPGHGRVPRTSVPTPRTPAGSPPHTAPRPAHAHATPATGQSQGRDPVVPLELAAAGFLAAGVLYALGRRRRQQARRRGHGQRVARPRPDAAWAEAALILGEDSQTAEVLDTALRHLGAELLRDGLTPPTVFAAHVGSDNVDLWVSPASSDAPAPWVAVGDGQVWRLPLAAARELDVGEVEDTPAPYPGLVTIGSDATGRVLVDVVSAHGLIALTGPDDMVRGALNSMATELATSRWSEGVRITLVGFGADLAALAPTGVRLVPTLAEALPDMEAWAAEVSEVLGTWGTATGRAEGLHTTDWEPYYLISAVPPASGWERDRLVALARTSQAAGAAWLTAGAIDGAAWTWELTEGGRLRARELGLDVEAQCLPHEQQVAIVDLFSTAEDFGGVPLAELPLAELPLAEIAFLESDDDTAEEPAEAPAPMSAPVLAGPVLSAPLPGAPVTDAPEMDAPEMDAPAAALSDAALADAVRNAGAAGVPWPVDVDALLAASARSATADGVDVTLLGHVGVRAPHAIDPRHQGVATELVAYLATHPAGVQPTVLATALWPRGSTAEERDAVLSAVTEWLGCDGIGRPHLASDTTGRLRLGSGVRVDWHVFCVLVAQAAQVQETGGTSRTVLGGRVGSGGHAARHRRAPDEAELLARALDLVGGPFVADRHRGAYSWLAVDGFTYEVEARVADAAHRLCELRLAADDPQAAMDAARAGLRLACYDELLWRDLLRAADATGRQDVLRGVVKDVRMWACLDGTDVALAPETEALIDDLLPTWRWSVA